MTNFDYQNKLWGHIDASINPFYIGAVKLKYALISLKNITGKIIDLGCGGGSFCRGIKKYRKDLDIYGIDISYKSINYAMKQNININYQTSDIYKIPFSNSYFTAVLSFDVFEHLEFPEKVFSEVSRILKPNGLFHFYVPLEGNFFTLYRLFPKAYLSKCKHSGHIQRFTYDKLKKMLEKTGFKIYNRKYSTYFIYQIADLIYFQILEIKNTKLNMSLEDYVSILPNGKKKFLIKIVKSILGIITYIENYLFSFFPGAGIHITAFKK